MTIIKTQGLRFAYKGDEVLRDISLDIQSGEFVGLIGPNGSGKTTLLKLIQGLLTPRTGEILIQGMPVQSMKRRDLARIIAVVPQEPPPVFPFLVQEVVLMGRSPHLAPWQFERPADYAIVHRALVMTDTLHLASRPMDHLSGGERQRVLIARALAQEPRIMVLDEPTAFLDIRHQVVFFNMMKRLNENDGLTVIAVTHDINLASLYCDRIILLAEGRIQVVGCPVDVVTEEHMQTVYHTPVFVDRHPILGLPRVTPRQEHPQENGSRCETGAAPQL